jgi:hypothetical protein
MRRIITIMGSAVVLAGCSTATSFAPPPVTVTYAGEPAVDTTCPSQTRQTSVTGVTRNLIGAYKLIDAYVVAFRCAAHAAADGRQGFEIPAFVSTTGAALATTLGGGATYGILGTGANAAFTAGNKYWDPKLKASIYDHALDALLCVKTEAVGIPAYKFENSGFGKMYGLEIGGSKISVPVERQYFEMVSSAVFSIERILAQRLSNMAPVDASAVAAELGKAIAEIQEAKKKREANGGGGGDTPPPAPETETDPNALADPDTDSDEDAIEQAGEVVEAREEQADKNKKAEEDVLNAFFANRAGAVAETVDLDLAVLKPELDNCVIRAKL